MRPLRYGGAVVGVEKHCFEMVLYMNIIIKKSNPPEKARRIIFEIWGIVTAAQTTTACSRLRSIEKPNCRQEACKAMPMSLSLDFSLGFMAGGFSLYCTRCRYCSRLFICSLIINFLWLSLVLASSLVFWTKTVCFWCTMRTL